MHAIADYREYNDPVRQFLAEMLPRFAWDLVPFSFLYDLYREWFHADFPSGTIVGRNIFIRAVVAMLSDFPEWECRGRSKSIRPGKRMDAPEPLIAQYSLTNWMNPLCRGRSQDIDMLCRPVPASMYNGLLRRNPRLTGK